MRVMRLHGRRWSVVAGKVLSTAGVAIIALGNVYAKTRDRIEGTVVRGPDRHPALAPDGTRGALEESLPKVMGSI